MRTCLFIGGTHDGLKYSAKEKPEYMQFTGRRLYLRETLTIGKVSVTIYVHESLTLAEAVARLFNYYNPWSVSGRGERL